MLFKNKQKNISNVKHQNICELHMHLRNVNETGQIMNFQPAFPVRGGGGLGPFHAAQGGRQRSPWTGALRGGPLTSTSTLTQTGTIRTRQFT